MTGHFPLCRVVVPGEPVPKGRPRVWKGRARTPLRTVEAELRFGWRVKAACVGLDLPSDRLFRVELVFRSTWPRGSSRGCDIDNATKLALDALNGVVWRDDHQVIELVAQMERGAATPETVISIYEEAV